MVRELTASETETLIERHIVPHPDPVKEGNAWSRRKSAVYQSTQSLAA